MPTITAQRYDLYSLAGLDAAVGLGELDAQLELVKGELNEQTRDGQLLLTPAGVWVESDEDFALRTNRPDLWSVEGIARQLRDHARGHGQSYDLATDPTTDTDAELCIEVDPRLESIRPFIGGFLARNATLDETGLLAFIEAQETLTRNFGRRRASVSIGLYNGADLAFPVQYRAVAPEAMRFEPLPPSGETATESWPTGVAMTPSDILSQHPTGREYAWIVEEFPHMPLLVDARERVLSFPPIINSARLGRVEPGAGALFVEATGIHLDHVLLTLNILAANLVDRGWTIVPVATHYPYDTPRGRTVTAPHPMAITQRAPLAEFARLLGEPVAGEDVVSALRAYGVAADLSCAAGGECIVATLPDYRQDYLHPVDVIEDFAISRGYHTFAPLMPADFTVGKLDPRTQFEDRVRDLLIGFGFEEAICNILTSEDTARRRMEVDEESGAVPFHGGPPVRITNVMNRNYSCLRDWVLPSLLEIESHSTTALYPHRICEVGEVAVYDPAQNLGSRTEARAAALMAMEEASFDAAQSMLYALLTSLDIAFTVEPWRHAAFIAGRVGLVRDAAAQPLGFVGELSPQVLTNWGVRVPVAAFELSVDAMYACTVQAPTE